MFRHRIFNHQNIYLTGLVLLGICLPVSLFGMSVSIFILSGNWILEGDFIRKFKIVREKKSIIAFFAILLIHLLWLVNTTDFNYGFRDIQVKLPLLALPLIVGTSRPVTSNQLKIILQFFIVSVFVATLISTAVLAGAGPEITDIREISLFISHIRFSLMINVAIFSLGYFLYGKEIKHSILETILYCIVMAWLITFLFLLQSLTGIGIFLIISFVSAIVMVMKLSNFMLRYFIILLLVTLPLLLMATISRAVMKFYDIEEFNPGTIEKATANGNPYFHDFNNRQVENGNYIWLFVCEKELENEWNRRSEWNYTGMDKKEQYIKYTLIRYLTSKGYRKDSLGICRLTSEDISLIEDGTANFRFRKQSGLDILLYKLIWQIDVYKKGGNPSGHSVTQRLEYLKTAVEIIKQNFWFGVGTGDVLMAFDNQYEKSNSMLSREWRFRAHNQFVTFLLTFGIFGFLFSMVALFYPVFAERKQNDYLFMMFFLIALLSMLNEDTLETHAGITFFSYFYALFLFTGNKSRIAGKDNTVSQ